MSRIEIDRAALADWLATMRAAHGAILSMGSGVAPNLDKSIRDALGKMTGILAAHSGEVA